MTKRTVNFKYLLKGNIKNKIKNTTMDAFCFIYYLFLIRHPEVNTMFCFIFRLITWMTIKMMIMMMMIPKIFIQVVIQYINLYMCT